MGPDPLGMESASPTSWPQSPGSSDARPPARRNDHPTLPSSAPKFHGFCDGLCLVMSACPQQISQLGLLSLEALKRWKIETKKLLSWLALWLDREFPLEMHQAYWCLFWLSKGFFRHQQSPSNRHTSGYQTKDDVLVIKPGTGNGTWALHRPWGGTPKWMVYSGKSKRCLIIWGTHMT